MKDKNLKKCKKLLINKESNLHWIGDKGGKFCFNLDIFHLEKNKMKSYTLGSDHYTISWDWHEFLKKSMIIHRDFNKSNQIDRSSDTYFLNKTVIGKVFNF